MNERFSPGCRFTGHCRCASGSVLDPVDGYCYRQRMIPFNATCLGWTVWEVFPEQAECDENRKVVRCVTGFRVCVTTVL